MVRVRASIAAAVVAAAALFGVSCKAQTFQRLGACPSLGCIFPPDQADFLAGQYFDVRLEVHAPWNGSQAVGRPADERFKFTVAKVGQDGARSEAVNAAEYFGTEEPGLEKWSFSWYEDLFARDADRPSVVNVTAKAYRRVALYEPGEYVATLTYNNGTETRATWLVRDMAEARRTKNVILFIGDGMTTNMITAARLIAHKQINGKYQTKMQLDQFPVLGHQMTHSLDTFITDSANSASALNTGHKSSSGALGVYADSSESPFDDPKVETIAEIFQRVWGGHIGIVSTASIADATPAAINAHTRDRGTYEQIVDMMLHGNTNYTWPEWTGADVILGGGGEQFYNSTRGGSTYQDRDYYREFAGAGYNVVLDKDELEETANDTKTLGVFTTSNMAKWLDRNVYTANLNRSLSPTGDETAALKQPGLKEMTLKAVDILATRSGKDGTGFFLMSEAASIDKMMHVLDYDRALGELLELDDTVKATVARLREADQLKDTLVLVTADHGHGFDVMGSVDTKYMAAQTEGRKKRSAVGVYEQSGQSQYVLTGNLSYTEGVHFPANWEPDYTLFAGVSANPDRREDWRVHRDGPREPAVELVEGSDDYHANPADGRAGIGLGGNLPVDYDQGVHSLTDVPVFAMGPCQELFGGVYNSVDVFFGMAECLGLSRSSRERGNDDDDDGEGDNDDDDA